MFRNLIWGLLLMTQTTVAQNANFVNVFIGTSGTGHTFPGPSMPFGMVQPGPDNRDFGWNYTSGYQYNDSLLLGFSQTRFNGTGINEMGDVLLMPVNPEKAGLKNAYFKNTEEGKPGYYRLVKKDDVKVELTCSERVAFHRYTFPDRQAQVLIDLQHGLRFIFDEQHPKSLVTESDVKMIDDRTITGYCATQNWVNRKYFFTLTFDQPFASNQKLQQFEFEKAPRFLLNFNLKPGNRLRVKIALSSVSVDGSSLNLRTEIPGWDFDAVVQKNQQAWNKYLNRITISAPKKQQEIFYTSLYHLLLQPSNIADVNGMYRGANDQIAQAPNQTYYSTLSIWDIYRGAFPLLQIIAPEKIDGIVQSMLLHHRAAGFLPIWTAWGQDNYCMIGNHAIPMLLSAAQNGFTGFNQQEALQAMVETSTRPHINSDWKLYDQYGYYPFDPIQLEAVSKTLESGYDDWCVTEMARKLNQPEIAHRFSIRAAYYKNLFDPGTHFFRGRDTSGNWRTPFNPLMATSPLNNPGDYTEANAWQYFWTPAQYDLSGIIQLLGGKAAFTQKLDSFFTTNAEHPNKFLGQEAMIGQYAHGNEPSHHVIYLYAFSQYPQTGQRYIHEVVHRFHNNTPDGMIGNDDCGQMSAWYIFATLGFYPVNPASGEFVFGSPQVKQVQIQLQGGKQLNIFARNFSSRAIYNRERVLNSVKLDRPFIHYKEIMNGGTLTYKMTER